MSDDGCDSNAVYIRPDGTIWEWYRGQLDYPHATVACRNHHHFKVSAGKISDHIDNLDGVSRGWVYYDLLGWGK